MRWPALALLLFGCLVWLPTSVADEFKPALLEPEELQALCIKARAEFYSIPNILRRFRDPVNRSSPFMARQYPLINWMMRREVRQRDDLPLGDEGWNGRLGHACGQV